MRGVSTRTHEHQAQLDSLADVYCREILVETASTRDARPQLRRALGMLRAGDTLVGARRERGESVTAIAPPPRHRPLHAVPRTLDLEHNSPAPPTAGDSAR